MRADRHRISLTVPDDIYELILFYKECNCISTDASACLQLIKHELDRLKFSLDYLEKLP